MHVHACESRGSRAGLATLLTSKLLSVLHVVEIYLQCDLTGEIDIYVEACLAQALRVGVETVFTHGLAEKRAT